MHSPAPVVSARSSFRSRLKTGWLGAWAMLAIASTAVSGAFAQATLAEPAPKSAQVAKPAAVKSGWSRLHWRDLDAEQQKALGPLASQWDGLSEVQKRKWLVIVQNQGNLTPAERAVQHSRMTEWVGLSRQQREQARFNFDEVKRVPVEERKAKWEAYQALSAAEKQRLADSAAKRPQGAAGTIRPVPAQKLAPVPASQGGGRPGPRIELAPASQPGSATPAVVSRPASSAGEPSTVTTPAPVVPPAVPLLPN